MSSSGHNLRDGSGRTVDVPGAEEDSRYSRARARERESGEWKSGEELQEKEEKDEVEEEEEEEEEEEKEDGQGRG
jgi:hypothetical protein